MLWDPSDDELEEEIEYEERKDACKPQEYFVAEAIEDEEEIDLDTDVDDTPRKLIPFPSDCEAKVCPICEKNLVRKKGQGPTQCTCLQFVWG